MNENYGVIELLCDVWQHCLIALERFEILVFDVQYVYKITGNFNVCFYVGFVKNMYVQFC